jgi:hypothetical protein
MNNQVELPENKLADDASAQEVIIHSITQTVMRRAAAAKDGEDIHYFPSLIKKKNCFVQHREDDSVVKSSGQLIELVKDAVDVVHEAAYHGRDHESVYILRVMLSDSYIARVSNVMLKDVPERYFNQAYGKDRRDGLVVRSFKNRQKGKPNVLKMLCIDLEPIWTDRGVDEIHQDQYGKYHCVSVKIKRDNLEFLGWVPGIDTQTQPCAGLEDMFVSLGDRDISMDPEVPKQHHSPRKLTFGQFKR